MPRRWWPYYAAAWLPFAALWSLLVFRYRGSATFAVVAGIVMMGAAAAAGAAVFRLTRDRPLPWPPPPGFFLRHLGGALALAAVMIVMDACLAGGYERRSPIAFLRERRDLLFVWDVLVYSWLYGLLAAASYVLHGQRRLREREVAAARAEAQAARAQVRALRAQLNPHFLFNALHSLSTLVRHEPRVAEEAIDRLGSLLRYALDDDASDDVGLDEEWSFTCHYLALESLRLGDRLAVRSDVDPEALDCIVPSFILQPLVENAVRHGVARTPSGGTVEITLQLEADDLVLRVADDGPGADGEPAASARGFGLRAVRERLAVRFGGRATMDVETKPGAGFAVRIRMPAAASARRRVPA